jgi:hypothetical protein
VHKNFKPKRSLDATANEVNASSNIVNVLSEVSVAMIPAAVKSVKMEKIQKTPINHRKLNSFIYDKQIIKYMFCQKP